MKALKAYSIDEIIKMPVSPGERLRKFFKVGRQFRVGVIEDLVLIKLENNHPTKAFLRIELDIKMEAQDIGDNKYRWLVFTDEKGNRFGLSVERMLVHHKDGDIEVEPLTKYHR